MATLRERVFNELQRVKDIDPECPSHNWTPEKIAEAMLEADANFGDIPQFTDVNDADAEREVVQYVREWQATQ